MLINLLTYIPGPTTISNKSTISDKVIYVRNPICLWRWACVDGVALHPPSRQVHLTSPSQVVLPGYNQASHRATKSVVSKNVPADVRPMRSERRKVGRDRTEYYKQYYLNNPAYFREHGRKQQQEIKKYIQQQKVGLSCKRCGNDVIRVLDFHHTDKSSKEASIASMAKRGWSQERILQEIVKCEVLCANCHRILHWEDGSLGRHNEG